MKRDVCLWILARTIRCFLKVKINAFLYVNQLEKLNQYSCYIFTKGKRLEKPTDDTLTCTVQWWMFLCSCSADDNFSLCDAQCVKVSSLEQVGSSWVIKILSRVKPLINGHWQLLHFFKFTVTNQAQVFPKPLNMKIPRLTWPFWFWQTGSIRFPLKMGSSLTTVTKAKGTL